MGIGGVSMSAIALMLQNAGYEVTGSDRQDSEIIKILRKHDISVFIGHDAKNVEGADVVVYTAAIASDNVELVEARRRGISTVERPVLLGQLMADYEHKIAVAGAHGKTTTVAMTTAILEQAGWHPTALLGTDRDNLKLGEHRVIITEACEAFGSFLFLKPSVTVVLNIDADHLDYYGTIDQIERAFQQFMAQTEPGGYIIACADDNRVQRVLQNLSQSGAMEKVTTVSFGFSERADYRAVNIFHEGLRSRYTLLVRGEPVGDVKLGVPGDQNIMNSLAAIGVGLELGISFETACRALENYRGAPRRFEVLYDGEVVVIDDYAHHPTEIEATIESARSSYGGRITAVFQPHLYSRTKFLLDEFARALSRADEVIVAPIYPAREEPIPGVSGASIVECIRRMGHTSASYASDIDQLPNQLAKGVKPGDVVLVMGAGDIRRVAEKLASMLRGGSL